MSQSFTRTPLTLPPLAKKRKERGTRQESLRVRFWRAGRLAICIWRLRSDLSGSIVNANPAQISLDAIFALRYYA
jgi:hypothetical protein